MNLALRFEVSDITSSMVSESYGLMLLGYKRSDCDSPLEFIRSAFIAQSATCVLAVCTLERAAYHVAEKACGLTSVMEMVSIIRWGS